MNGAIGIETGALVSLSVYYLLKVFPGKFRPFALVIGVSLTSLELHWLVSSRCSC